VEAFSTNSDDGCDQFKAVFLKTGLELLNDCVSHLPTQFKKKVTGLTLPFQTAQGKKTIHA